MHRKIIIEENGKQKVLPITDSGSYNGSAAVVWDTKTDGALPAGYEANLGGLEKSGDALVLNQAKKDTYDALLVAKAAAIQAAVSKREAADLFLSNFDKDTATSADLAEGIHCLAIKLGLK